MARKSKTKRPSLGVHLAHPLPGLRVVKGKGDKRQLMLGRPGVWSRAISSSIPSSRSEDKNVEREDKHGVSTAVAPPEISVDVNAASEERVSQLWLEGLDAFEANEQIIAGDLWSQALILDPDCADAMLGLHALNPGRDDLLRRMGETIENFGVQRAAHQRQLTSSYRPAGFMIEQLDLADDLRRALAIYEHREGNEAQANELLGDSRPCTLTSAVWARIAFENSDYKRCLSICQKLHRDAEIAADIDLMMGCSLVALEFSGPAIEILQRAALNAAEVEAELHARYYLMLAYEQEGHVDEAQEQLELIYSSDVDFADVATRLGVSASNPDRLPAEGIDPAWDSLVSSLTTGDLATDPSIADNKGSR